MRGAPMAYPRPPSGGAESSPRHSRESGNPEGGARQPRTRNPLAAARNPPPVIPAKAGIQKAGDANGVPATP